MEEQVIPHSALYSALHVRLHLKSHEKLFVLVMCDQWYHTAGLVQIGSTSKMYIICAMYLSINLHDNGPNAFRRDEATYKSESTSIQQSRL
jgi:hypothetical protein